MSTFRDYERYDMTDNRHRNILLVEDTRADIIIIRKMFQSEQIPHSLFIVRDGEDALAFLESDAPKPHVILMDIHMPRMGGLEALENIKKNPQLNDIPVIMSTTSVMKTDIETAQRLGANGYIVKPAACSLQDLLGVVNLVASDPGIFLKGLA